MFKRTMLSVAACATLLAAPFAHATTYYVNNASWGDGNPGTSTSLPWRTVAKVNSNAVVSGDTVLFAAGGTWDETLIVKSGVTYGSYNSGVKPIIRGSRAVGSLTWTRTSSTSNIWWATTNTTVESGAISQLYLNGVRLQRARHPNVGQGAFGANSRYLAVANDGDIQTLNLSQDATQMSKLPLGGDIKGATAYVRVDNSDLNVYTVVDWASNGAYALQLQGVNVIDGWDFWLKYPITKGWGYWLENKLWMLDSPGEWYFDADAHKLYVWMPNSASPQGQALFAGSQPGIVAVNASNFTISNLEVRETLGDAVSIKGGSNASLVSLSINRPGGRGISMMGATNNGINSVNVQDSVRDGIWLGDARGWTASTPSINTTVMNNTVNNSGKGYRADGGIFLGDGGITSNNVVTNSTNIGIVAQKQATIKNNLVKNSCLDFDDCGGIYVGGLANGAVLNTVVQGNIVDGGPGSADGSIGSATDTRGIYLDDLVNTVTVTGNYVTGMRHGIMLHSAKNITVTQNTAYKNRNQGLFLQEDKAGDMVNNQINQNMFLSIGFNYPNLLQVSYGGTGTNSNMGTYNQNHYVALQQTEQSLLYNYVYSGSTTLVAQNLTLAAWQQTGQDLNSSYRVLSNDTDAAYGFYNPTGSADTTVSCPATVQSRCAAYVDLKNNNSVTFPLSLPTNSFIVIGR